MPEPTLPRVVGAFLRRDLLSASSLRTALIARTISLLVALASLAYLSSFVDAGGGALDARYGRAGYLGFFLVGLAVGEIFHAVALALSTPIREAQLAGTLEAILSTPAPVPHVLCGVAASTLLFAVLRLVLYFAGAILLFGVRLGPAHATSLLLVGVLAALAFGSVAVLGGALTMHLRRTDPISMLVGTAAVLVGGVLYPVDLLPWPLARLAYALPLAPTLEALRRALFAAAPPSSSPARSSPSAPSSRSPRPSRSCCSPAPSAAPASTAASPSTDYPSAVARTSSSSTARTCGR